MRTMTREEWLQFVSTGTRTGKLASTRASGSPHVAPVWFLIDQTPDGDDVVLDLPLTVGEAALGTKVEVPTVEGSVRLTVPAGTSCGAKLRIRGKRRRCRCNRPNRRGRAGDDVEIAERVGAGHD